ncbi:radical SAM protein [uncultured Treponema sp.]|uniref:B12-binding domain-containing radical SAM protein n=1 Tax=uncultured Treponema sp. TaxID=162155 RepID=UPI000E826AB3|nr:radical SAM protein [uncultured Treponema sp.]HAZ96576.1 radical SAM protein [Treponema sp.]
MNIIVIQPPLVQLNSPYPSGAYLKSFFNKNGHKAIWLDLSVQLVHSIFSKNGLKKLFELSKENAMKIASAAEKNGDFATAKNLRRYIFQSDLWIEWIDFIMSVLCGKQNPSSRELCHRFILSPYTPRGNRMENYISNLDREPNVDDTRNIASLALEDLADYISVAFDKSFSLVRYAESIAVNETSFNQIEEKLNSPVLTNFYAEVLEDEFSKINISENEKTLVCISVPFAGTFTPALFSAKYLREKYGERLFICFGGGFINTELREFCDSSFFKYADAISYDRGYGSYKNFFDVFPDGKVSEENQIYKMRLFAKEKVIEPLHSSLEYEKFENEQTALIVPDYSETDFSIYPRVADDENPMQRLWSDGAWMKAYLAHGCYWHKCAFCDVSLDYVASYRLVQIENLFYELKSQSEKNGIHGIHFVDEAMPPAAMIKFSKLSLKHSASFSFWGNVRFEKIYSRDMAEFLSFGGLIGVSGGIEIATGTGLDSISKGTDLDSIVSACCAFKEAGILIHAYMIYGYFGETEQDTINSMETLRQLYAAGLIDSCFWHKFVLTRHSRIYSEWKEGLHKNLNPFAPKNSGVFAKNGLHFKDEEKSTKFGNGLYTALQSWMHGENLNVPVEKWFEFKVPHPNVSKDLIAKSIEKYEERRNKEWNFPLNAKKLFWLAGNIVLCENKFLWNYMHEDFKISVTISSQEKEEFIHALYCLSPKNFDSSFMENLIQKNPGVKKILRTLRGKGLVML